MRLFVQAPNFSKLALRTKKLTEAARFGLKAGVAEGAMIIHQEAQDLAPEVTGELKSGIITRQTVDEPERQVIEVASTAGHAQFVEYGTGLTGAASEHPPLPTEGVPITGEWVYDYKRQNWPGMAAQPHMRPALDGKAGEVRSAIKDSILGEVLAAQGNR